MIFNSRLNGHDIKAPETCTLCDAVDSMTDRAMATVLLLEFQFEKNDCRASDEIVLNALEAVRMELQDIKGVVDSFHDSQKKPQ